MKYIFSTTLILCLFINGAVAQYTGYPVEENVSKAEKLRKQFPDCKAYSNSSTVEYKFSINSAGKETKVSCNETGREEFLSLSANFAEKKQLFYSHNSNVNLLRFFYIKGRREKPFQVTVANMNYESDGIFHNDIHYKAFALPFERIGDNVGYSYTKNHSDVRYFATVTFHEDYPIAKKEVKFVIPDNINIELKEFNFDGYKIQKSVQKDEKKHFTTYTYTVKDLKEVKWEDNANRFTFEFPHILVVPKGYTYQKQTNKIFSDVSDLYNWVYSLNKEVSNDKSKLDSIVKVITKDKANDEEKIKAIYYWVQDNIRYIAFEDGIAGYQPAPAQEVYANKYGDCKGMANLLTNMLQIAGYDAHFAWIGTTSVLYDYSSPCIAVNNHAITTLDFNGNTYYLDGTEKYIDFGNNAERIQGREILIDNNGKYELKVVPVAEKEKSKNIYVKNITLSNDLMKVKGEDTYTGEYKTGLLRYLNNVSSEKQDKLFDRIITKGDRNYKVDTFTYSKLDDRSVPLVIKYDAEVKNKVLVVDNEVYIAMDLNNPYTNLIDEKRERDYLFNRKINDVYTYELTVPPGYSVKYVPAKLEEKSDSYSVIMEYVRTGDKIILTVTVSFSEGIIKKKDLAKWRDSQKKIKAFSKDQIVLLKNR